MRNPSLDEKRAFAPLTALAVHERWSAVNTEFFDHVDRFRTYLNRDTFATIVQGAPQLSPLQPWPIFVGPRQRQKLADVAVPVARLFKSVLARFFQNDPTRIARFYAADNREAIRAGESVFPLQISDQLVTLLLEAPGGVDAVPSRGDYIDSPDGLKCIEFNAGGNLGGLQVERFSKLYIDSAPITEFCRVHGVNVRPPDAVGALFRHIIEDTRHLRIWQRGDFNLAMLVRPHQPEYLAVHSEAFYTLKLARAVAQCGDGAGRVFLCGPEDLTESPAGLYVGGQRIHAIVEQHDGTADMRRPFRHFMRGTVNLYSSPLSQLLTDKRNVALLSAHAESDVFTAAERTLIARHIPWTRRLEYSETTFRGGAVRVPQDVRARRSEFLLKKATSLGGAHVHFGATTTGAAWDALLERALREGDWIIQECVPSMPYHFQSGPFGAERHEVIWGLYVFGEHFGGSYLRMMPVDGGQEVINCHRGAEVGMPLEVDR